jgi:hypothetical protein
MSISTFIDPSPHIFLPPPPAKARKRSDTFKTTWQDCAASQDWENAIILRLREPERPYYYIWRIVKEIVAESIRPTRREVRKATVEVLRTITQLRRQNRLKVSDRKYLSCLDYEGVFIPFDDGHRL